MKQILTIDPKAYKITQEINHKKQVDMFVALPPMHSALRQKEFKEKL